MLFSRNPFFLINNTVVWAEGRNSRRKIGGGRGTDTKEVKREGEQKRGCLVCFQAAGSHISCVQLALEGPWCRMRGGVRFRARGEACLLKPELD